MKHQAFVTWVLATALTFGALAAAAPGTIPIRGQLLDGDGLPLAGARAYAVQFYDAEMDGTALGGELTGTTTLSAEGLFTLSVAPPTEILSSTAVWYAIAVDSDATPNGIDANDWFPERVKVESVPFALQAGEVVHVDASSMADGSVSDAEFEALDGVSGNIQTQLDAKLEAADIDANTAATATNTANISSNTSDIAANTTGIATNATNIATNTAGIATKADAASVDASQATQDAAIATNMADIGTNSTAIATNTTDIAANVTAIAAKAEAVDVLPRVGEAHVLVTVTSNATTNGTNLLAAYAEAKALTPHGAALSATNRAVVIVPPGNYDLGTAQLTMDTEFVDLVGLTTARDAQYIFGASNGVGTGVLGQTADDVLIENLLIDCTRSSGTQPYDATQPAAYFPDTNKPNTYIRNCSFMKSGAYAYSMRGDIEYSGTFTDCSSDGYSFGGGGTASGAFINCTSGAHSFGGASGTASGTFTNCTGGDFAFGGSGTASGTFTNCTGGQKSFGGNGTASGIFTNCAASSDSFGGNNGPSSTASGTFTNCIGGTGSFGGYGTASGTFVNCTGGSLSFGFSGDAMGGKFYFCNSGSSSFTTTGSPTVVYCVRNGVAYP